jgi:hypothetical protein
MLIQFQIVLVLVLVLENCKDAKPDLTAKNAENAKVGRPSSAVVPLRRVEAPVAP